MEAEVIYRSYDGWVEYYCPIVVREVVALGGRSGGTKAATLAVRVTHSKKGLRI